MPCDTNGAQLPTRVAAVMRDVPRRRCRAWALGIHTHNDAECAVANTLAAVEAGRAPRPGHDQRLRRALRQRQPHLDHPQPAAEDGLRVPSSRSGSSELTGASATSWPRPPTSSPTPGAPYVGSNAFAHKGGMHVAGHERGRPRPTSTSTRRSSATSAACWCPSCRAAGTIVAKARELGIDAGRGPASACRDPRAPEGPGAPGLPLRGRRRLLRAAAASARRASTSRCSCSRASA